MKPVKSYYRIMLGGQSSHSDEAYQGGFIGGDWDIDVDLTGKFPDNVRDFNREFIPLFMEKNPDKSKVAAGLAGGMLYTICKGIQKGDLILSPNGSGQYYVGEVTSDYHYVPDGVLPHRRSVSWADETIERSDMSDGLKYSTGAIGTVSNVTKHSEEIENLIKGVKVVDRGEDVEDPAAFALEKHLEEFLVLNWRSTTLARKYEIYSVDGEIVGQQYPTDTGYIDILAISKDEKELLVVELKKGRASDVVVGQIQRYMGYVKDELAEADQNVKGIIIAMDDDLKIRRALSVANNIEFYRYEVTFNLIKA